jgi:hypothetical protein
MRLFRRLVVARGDVTYNVPRRLFLMAADRCVTNQRQRRMVGELFFTMSGELFFTMSIETLSAEKRAATKFVGQGFWCSSSRLQLRASKGSTSARSLQTDSFFGDSLLST